MKSLNTRRTASAAFVATALLASVLTGRQAVAADGGAGHTLVTVCHKPGTPAEHELTVDDDAVPAHLAHGDTLGGCPVVAPDPDPVVDPVPPVDPPADPVDPADPGEQTDPPVADEPPVPATDCCVDHIPPTVLEHLAAQPGNTVEHSSSYDTTTVTVRDKGGRIVAQHIRHIDMTDVKEEGK